MTALCKICEKKRGRRLCPGVGAEICAPCCAASREITIDCPSTCEYLREARFHEVPTPMAEELIPNKDIQLSESFIRDHDSLVLVLGLALKRAMNEAKAVDFDAREALEALIKTYRTLKSGLIYETRPANPYAAGLQDKITDAIQEMQKRLAGKGTSIPDVSVLGSLVFLQRLELQYNNGRRRGRAFKDFLADYIPESAAPAQESSALVI